MPQDSLWATSARTVGLTIVYNLDCVTESQDDTMSVIPQWSKRPTGRDGSLVMGLPSYARDDVPEILTAVYNQWRFGDAKHVPLVGLQQRTKILREYSEGLRG